MAIKLEIGAAIHTFADGVTERPVSVRNGKAEAITCRVRFNRRGAYTVFSPTLPDGGCTPEQLETDDTVQAVVRAIDRMGERKLLQMLGVEP